MDPTAAPQPGDTGDPERAGADADAAAGHAAELLRQGRPADALARCVQGIAANGARADLHALAGVALRRLGRHAEAEAAYARAVALAPGVASTHLNRGLLLLEALRQPEAALACFDAALALDPQYGAAHFNRGNALRALGRPDAAQQAYERAVAAAPASFEAWMNLGAMHRLGGRADEAARCFEQARALRPGDAAPLESLAWAHERAGRPGDAERALRQAVERGPSARLHHRLGALLLAQGGYAAADAQLQIALRLEPARAGAWNDRGIALRELGRPAEAAAAFEQALRLAGDRADLHGNLGNALRDAGRLDEALDAYDRALAADPHAELWAGEALLVALELCRWQGLQDRLDTIARRLEAGEQAAAPFPTLVGWASARVQQRAAMLHARRRFGAAAAASGLPGPARAPGPGPIRVGFFSSDLGDHPVGHLLAPVLERLGRDGVECIAYLHGPARDDAWSRRIRAAVRCVDASGWGAVQTVAHARGQALDVAIDLNGYTRHARTEVFASRVAPVQVGCLGYVGTMGAPFIDYMVADATLVPPGARAAIDERLLRLPVYQPNDALGAGPPARPDRQACGLPAEAVVLACLNANHKVTPEIYAAWLRVLQRAPQAVLWLHAPHPQAQQALRREAAAAGVDPQRIVYAPRVDSAAHLARQAAADLFLDTHPYNAGATAAIALRAGVPLLTLAGEAPASRMGASLLRALRPAAAPDAASDRLYDALVATDLAGYEARALRLATDAAARDGLRAALHAALPASLLFDPDRYARALAAALRAAVDRHRRGLPPEDIDVTGAAGDRDGTPARLR